MFVRLLRVVYRVTQQNRPVHVYRVALQNRKVHVYRVGLQHRQVHVSAALHRLVQYSLSDIGEGIREVVIKDWFVKVGDTVSQFDNLCLVESDKATVNITSRYDGVISKLYYKVDEVAYVGKPLVDIEVADDMVPVHSSSDINKAEVPDDVPIEEKPVTERGKALATPAVRRIAKEHNVQLSEVHGTGAEGRVLKEDILGHVGKKQVAVPVVPAVSSPGVETRPITGHMKVMARTMTRSNTIPTFTYCDEVDITALVELRQQVMDAVENAGVRLSLLPFFVKALSRSLREYPHLNSSVDEACENITLKSAHNIGVAMDTPSGLIVPNIKSVQSLTVIQIAQEMTRLQERGRRGEMRPEDLAGGTITVSNIGAIGGTYARPLILAPEVVIVAIGKVKQLPRYDDNGELSRRAMLCVSWSADHRVIDGATMARFSNFWKDCLANPAALLLGV